MVLKEGKYFVKDKRNEGYYKIKVEEFLNDAEDGNDYKSGGYPSKKAQIKQIEEFLSSIGFEEKVKVNGKTFYIVGEEQYFFIFDENEKPFVYLDCYEGENWYFLDNWMVIIGRENIVNFNFETRELKNAHIH